MRFAGFLGRWYMLGISHILSCNTPEFNYCQVWTKVSYFFFYAEKFVGHSFIQIRKSCFFFPKTREKKTSWFFDFSRKIPEIFLFFFFCSRKSSSAIHSFDFKAVFFFWARKKKARFSLNQSILPKKVQKMNFAGKKKTVPLIIRCLLLDKAPNC